MAKKVKVTDTYLYDIANSIRDKNSEEELYYLKEMSDKIEEILIPEGSIEITENGSFNVYEKETAVVNVPVGVFPEGTLNITVNDQYNVTTYEEVEVNVPVGVFPVGTLDITENGEYDVNTKKKVNVNVVPRPDIHHVASVDEMNALTNIEVGDVCIIEYVEGESTPARDGYIYANGAWESIVPDVETKSY